jgi:hypothetical protein
MSLDETQQVAAEHPGLLTRRSVVALRRQHRKRNPSSSPPNNFIPFSHFFQGGLR